MKKKVILFICTHNSARSQMAEGFLNHLYRDYYEAHSAGTELTEVHLYLTSARFGQLMIFYKLTRRERLSYIVICSQFQTQHFVSLPPLAVSMIIGI